jgi:excisionase family DNA binding protein
MSFVLQSKDMETVFISLPKNELQDLIIDCMSASLKHIHMVQLPMQRDSNHWLSLNELCDYLPDKPAKPTVYGWVSKGEIPHHKKGKKLYFLKSEIDVWLQSGRRKTMAEIEAEAESQLTGKRKRR